MEKCESRSAAMGIMELDDLKARWFGRGQPVHRAGHCAACAFTPLGIQFVCYSDGTGQAATEAGAAFACHMITAVDGSGGHQA